MPTDLTRLPADQLAAELTRRQAEAERQQAEAEAAWQAEQQQRARTVWESWEADDAELQDQERKAQDALNAAVLNDPIIVAFIETRRLRHLRNHLRDQARLAARLLDNQPAADRVVDLRYLVPALHDDAVRLAETQAGRLAADESDATMRWMQEPEADRP